MNLKKPRIKVFDYDQYPSRNFDYPYMHISTWCLRDLLSILNPYEIKMLMTFSCVVKRNSNKIMNLAGKPAESRDEILSALGYIKSSNSSRSAMAHFVKEEIIKRVRDEDSFCGFSYYLNPYVMYYGATVLDTTYELFHDSKWRR